MLFRVLRMLNADGQSSLQYGIEQIKLHDVHINSIVRQLVTTLDLLHSFFYFKKKVKLQHNRTTAPRC